MSKRIFIIADHGLALIYFLQSDVVPTLLKAGVEVVLLTDDEALPDIESRFRQPGLIFEGIRVKECQAYYRTVSPLLQRWLDLLRWTGGSKRINTVALDGNFHLVTAGYTGGSRFFVPLLRLVVWMMRRCRPLRRMVVRAQSRFTPAIYTDLFEKYRPDLVVSRTPGWRMDRYLLREAARHGVRTAAVTVGWDNPSSYAMNGAPVGDIICWSEIQKEELVLGSDWEPEHVHVGGIPAYDGYFRKQWLIGREEYFRLHGLDPRRKLLAYACSFETLHPNFPNMRVLAELVNREQLSEPCQLLLRFHPNHFIAGSRFEQERQRTIEYVRDMPHVHVVDPVSLGAGLAHYSGEDMPEKASMMAWADVFLTVYSTMVVETAIHDRPIVSVTIDTPGGWNMKDVYSLPLTAIGDWPTHQRFRQAGAGRVADTPERVRQAIDHYLQDPRADSDKRHKFIRDECTFTDGSAGKRTGEFVLSLLAQAERETRHARS
jgi:hypothetical protein